MAIEITLYTGPACPFAFSAGPSRLRLRWHYEEPTAHDALARDIAAARDPSPAARALDHKLGGPSEQRRYTAPSYELRRAGGTATASVPGYNPAEVYEAAIANLDPELARRSPPSSVTELLEWADAPLATAEVVAIMQRPEAHIRAELAVAAVATPAGADTYWSLADA